MVGHVTRRVRDMSEALKAPADDTTCVGCVSCLTSLSYNKNGKSVSCP